MTIRRHQVRWSALLDWLGQPGGLGLRRRDPVDTSHAPSLMRRLEGDGTTSSPAKSRRNTLSKSLTAAPDDSPVAVMHPVRWSSTTRRAIPSSALRTAAIWSSTSVHQRCSSYIVPTPRSWPAARLMRSRIWHAGEQRVHAHQSRPQKLLLAGRSSAPESTADDEALASSARRILEICSFTIPKPIPFLRRPLASCWGSLFSLSTLANRWDTLVVARCRSFAPLRLLRRRSSDPAEFHPAS
jgi:hypothetical protein